MIYQQNQQAESWVINTISFNVSWRKTFLTSNWCRAHQMTSESQNNMNGRFLDDGAKGFIEVKAFNLMVIFCNKMSLKDYTRFETPINSQPLPRKTNNHTPYSLRELNSSAMAYQHAGYLDASGDVGRAEHIARCRTFGFTIPDLARVWIDGHYAGCIVKWSLHKVQ